MDIGKAFSFVGDDPRWVNKILIGGGLVFAGILTSITVVGGLVLFAIVFGYCLQLTRNVIAGERQPLPEWADWGRLMGDGFKSIAVSLALGVPILLIYLLFGIPSAVLNAASETGTSDAGMVVLGIGVCLALPLALITTLISPIAIGRLAATGSIGQALKLGGILTTLRANFVTYLLVLLIGIVAGFISNLGLLACGIGLPFTAFYAYLVNYHLYGQAHRQTQGAQPGYGQPQQSYPQSSPF